MRSRAILCIHYANQARRQCKEGHTRCIRTYGFGPKHVSHTIGKSDRSQPSASGSASSRLAMMMDTSQLDKVCAFALLNLTTTLCINPSKLRNQKLLSVW